MPDVQFVRGWHIVSALSVLLAGAALPARAQDIIVDNTDPGFSVISRNWSTSTLGLDYYGSNYRYRQSTLVGEVGWSTPITAAGNYEVAVWYPAGVDRPTNAPYTVHYSGGSQTVLVNQQINGGQWFILGTFPFLAGATAEVRLTNVSSSVLRTVADAVRFTYTGPPPPPAPEFRGLWTSRFEWPSTNVTSVQSTVTTIMDKLQQHNFNAILFQVRGQMDTLYPSPEEPWSPIVSPDGNTPPGWGSFDPMAFAIQQAHARGLEFHAYINTHVAWQSSASLPPNYSAAHPFWQYTNAADPDKRAWLIHDETGTPVQFSESSYVWVAPGVPAAQAYTRRQVMYIVENYDVDGVHFDRIRTPGNNPANKWSHDPISEARFAGEGNPHSLNWADWTRDQITRQLQDLYAQVMEVKPQIKVSSAPLGLYRGSSYAQYGYPQTDCGYFYGYTCTYQDAQGWLAAGAQDFIVPQIYWASNGVNPEFREILPDWVANNAGRHVYAGQAAYKAEMTLAEMIDQVVFTRQIGGQGTVPFSWSSFNFWNEYSAAGGVYEHVVPTPEMPWKTNPTQGIIIGNVVGLDDVTPVVDCHVTRTGSSYVALSSADGLYSFLLVDPGSYTLTFNKAGLGLRQIENVSVSAGQVTRLDVSFGAGLPPVIVTHPAEQAVCPGAVIDFTVSASGTGMLTYRWQRNEIDIENGGGISGADTPILRITGVTTNDVGAYRCVVSNDVGSTPSDAADLVLKGAAVIDQQPAPLAIPIGSPATFTVAASGDTSFTYQWQKDGSNLANGGRISGATSAALQIEHVALPDLANYRCIVTAECGSTETQEAALTLSHAPGDFDLDGDVDQEDFGHLQKCFSGSELQPDVACRNSDFNGDGFVNAQDLDIFVKCASGSNFPADTACAD